MTTFAEQPRDDVTGRRRRLIDLSVNRALAAALTRERFRLCIMQDSICRGSDARAPAKNLVSGGSCG